MKNAASASKEILRGLMILTAAMATGVFLFMVVAVVMNQINGPPGLQWREYQVQLSWIVAVVCIICFLTARWNFSKGIQAAKNSINPLNEKLNRYRTSLIQYLAVCEAPALLSIVIFILTGYFVFLVFAAVMLGFMLAVVPLRRRVVTALELNWEEQKELD